MTYVQKLCNRNRVFKKKLGFYLYMSRDQLTTSVNLIAQAFPAVVNRKRFAVNKTLRLCTTLFTGLILDYMDCLGYF